MDGRKVKGAIATFALLGITLFKYGNRDVMHEYADIITNVIPSVHAETGTGDTEGNNVADDGKGTISRVVDGDTFVVNINGRDTKVRLIGIDTPESVSSSDRLVNTGYGEKACDYVKSLLPEGTPVTLKYDEGKNDTYGRTLAYVYVKINGKNTMMNKHLLKKGYARAAYYAPNDRHRREFRKYHKAAKKKRVGFWGKGKTASEGFRLAFPTKKEKEY